MCVLINKLVIFYDWYEKAEIIVRIIQGEALIVHCKF